MRILAPQPQLRVEAPVFNRWFLAGGVVWVNFYRLGQNYLLRFPDLADFQITGTGQSVCCWPVPGTSQATLQHLYLNQVLPLALSRQDKLIFHASAIESDAGALAFMGNSGRGKSTLAASFASRGFRFLTDDGLLLAETSAGFMVQPSHPSIRLWADSRAATIGSDAPLAPPVQYTAKERLLSGGDLRHCDEPRPLRRVYFLGDGSASKLTIRAMSTDETLTALLRYSFLLDMETREMLARHFDQLSRLMALPIYHSLDFPRRFEDLADVRDAVLAHANSSPSGLSTEPSDPTKGNSDHGRWMP